MEISTQTVFGARRLMDRSEQHGKHSSLRERYLSALVEMERRLLTHVKGWKDYDYILDPLGQASDISHVCLVENYWNNLGELRMRQQARWCSPTLPAMVSPPCFDNLPYSLFPQVYQSLSQGEPYMGQLISPGDPPETLSALILPLTIQGEWIGFVGFGDRTPERTWSTAELTMLRAAAAAISLHQERQRAENSLRQAEACYRSLFENAVGGIFQANLDGHYITANPVLARIYGYESPEELIEASPSFYVDPQRQEQIVDLLVRHGEARAVESQARRRDGSIIWVAENFSERRDTCGNLIGYAGTVEDITQRRQAEAALQRRDRLLQGVAQATQHLLTDPNYETTIPKVLAILGAAADADRVYIFENHPHPNSGEIAMSLRFEWVRAPARPLTGPPPWQNRPYFPAMGRWYEIFAKGEALHGSTLSFPASEGQILVQDNVVGVLMMPIFVDNQFWGFLGFDRCQSNDLWSGSEISILRATAASIGGALKQQKAEAIIRYQAFHDLLTGLPNRRLFNDRLTMALRRAQRNSLNLAVLFLDMDRFKTINDTLGHAVGDLLLQQVAKRFSGCLRQEDTLARWGGDEFTLLLPEVGGPEDVARVAYRLLESLNPVFDLEGTEVYTTGSAGVSMFPEDGRDGETLLRNADAALYRAKKQGRNTYQFYLSAMNSTAYQRLSLENHLHQAVQRGEFLVRYQPQVNINTWRLTGLEALMLWQHPALGLLTPDVFMPVAEETGLILPLGEWFLGRVCAESEVWQQAGLPKVPVTVGISPQYFQQPSLGRVLSQVLAQKGVEPACLALEISEGAILQNPETALGVLAELGQLGIHLSINSFGFGRTFLECLKQVHVDILKICPAFIQDLPTNVQDAAIVAAIIALGRGLNLRVVAEGVASPLHVQKLLYLQCQEIQGDLLGSPLGMGEMIELLQGGPRHQNFLYWPKSLLGGF